MVRAWPGISADHPGLETVNPGHPKSPQTKMSQANHHPTDQGSLAQRIFTVAETAERLRLSNKKIRHLIRIGAIIPLKSVRPYRITLNAILKYEEGR